MTTSDLSGIPDTTNPNPRCPKCGNVEAWHGVVTEPDESPRSACDACGHVEDTLYGWEEYAETPAHPCPAWCTTDHARDAAYPGRPDPDDVFSHDAPDLACIASTRAQLSGECRHVPGELVRVVPQLWFTRAGEEWSRLVMVDVQRDLTPSEARQVAAALVLSAEMLEATR